MSFLPLLFRFLRVNTYPCVDLGKSTTMANKSDFAAPGEEPTTPQTLGDDEAQVQTHTAEDEKRLVMKLDFYIIPLVMVLYLFSFLDRFVVFAPRLFFFLGD